MLNPLSANITKWSNTLKQFKLPTNCLSVFDHFVGLDLKGLIKWIQYNLKRSNLMKVCDYINSVLDKKRERIFRLRDKT